MSRHTKTYLILFVLIAMLPVGLYAKSNSKQKIVKVGYFVSPRFQEGGDDKAYKDGYGYEYLTKIKYFTNWKYKYVYGTWEKLYDQLQKGEIDIMAGISYSKERATQLLFPEEAMGSENDYIYTRSDNTNITTNDPSVLNGKKIGAVQNSMMQSALKAYVKEHKLNVTIVNYNDFSECSKAFSNHEIDYLVSLGNSTSNDATMVPVFKIYSCQNYLAFSKSRTDLLAEYNKALVRLNDIDPYFNQNLQYDYFSDNTISNSLSPLESQWIKNHKTIRIGYLENYLPYSDSNQGGQATGIVTNVIKEICQRLHIDKSNKIQYIGFTNYDYMTKALKNGSVDAVFPVSGNSWSAEQEGIFVSTPVVSSNMTLVFRHEYNDNTISKIAVNRNNRMQLNYTKSCYPNAEIYYVNSIEDCLKAVNDGKATSTVVNGVRIINLLTGSDYASLSYISLAKYDSRCFGFDAGNDSTLTIINRGLKLIGPDFGKNATREYATSEYTFMAFARDHVLGISFWILLIAIVIVVLIMYNHQRTKGLLNLVSSRNAELEKAQKEAEYANSAKTKFLNSMSHDIRTPMNAIIGFTNIAKERTNDPVAIADYLQKIGVSSNHLLSLINEILDMSRIESGKIQLNKEEMSITEQVNNLRIITEESAKEKDLNLIFNLDGITDDYVTCDKLRLCQILINIIGNAIKYTNNGGWVKVDVKETSRIADNATYTFSVKDNGIGMSSDYVKHIFEAFTRERTSTVSKIQGTGLGMAITKNLVEMMGGNIDVHSEEGKGSEFIITLTMPVIENKAKVANNVTQEEYITFDGRRVLIVEDNELNQEIASVVLQEMGFVTDVTDNGQLAIDAVTSHEANYYDIILMDIQMPVMNGFEATRGIRALTDTAKAKTPIVAMTANAFEEDKRAAFDAGMNGHVAKPIDTIQLTEELRKVLLKK